MTIEKFFFGKLTIHALPHHWYTLGATVFIALIGLGMALYLTKTKRWGWLWRSGSHRPIRKRSARCT